MLLFAIGPHLPCIGSIRHSIEILHLLLGGQYLIKSNELPEQVASLVMGEGHGEIITSM
jgi:hypothetical protein